MDHVIMQVSMNNIIPHFPAPVGLLTVHWQAVHCGTCWYAPQVHQFEPGAAGANERSSQFAHDRGMARKMKQGDHC